MSQMLTIKDLPYIEAESVTLGNDTKGNTLKRESAGEWREQFLVVLKATGNVRAACESAGIARKTAYQHRNNDPIFADAWASCLDDAIDSLEEIATERAKAQSDTLMIFMLKALRPEKYRDNFHIETQTQTSIDPDSLAVLKQLAATFGKDLPDEQLQQALEQSFKRAELGP